MIDGTFDGAVDGLVEGVLTEDDDDDDDDDDNTSAGGKDLCLEAYSTCSRRVMDLSLLRVSDTVNLLNFSSFAASASACAALTLFWMAAWSICPWYPTFSTRVRCDCASKSRIKASL